MVCEYIEMLRLKTPQFDKFGAEVRPERGADRSAGMQCIDRVALRLIADTEANALSLQSSKTNLDAYQVNGFERSSKNEKF